MILFYSEVRTEIQLQKLFRIKPTELKMDQCQELQSKILKYNYEVKKDVAKTCMTQKLNNKGLCSYFCYLQMTLSCPPIHYFILNTQISNSDKCPMRDMSIHLLFLHEKPREKCVQTSHHSKPLVECRTGVSN